MSIVEAKLKWAMGTGQDPRKVSPGGTWFAWRPVRLETGKWAWMKRVSWFRPLGLFNEYRLVDAERVTDRKRKTGK